MHNQPLVELRGQPFSQAKPTIEKSIERPMSKDPGSSYAEMIRIGRDGCDDVLHHGDGRGDGGRTLLQCEQGETQFYTMYKDKATCKALEQSQS